MNGTRDPGNRGRAKQVKKQRVAVTPLLMLGSLSILLSCSTPTSPPPASALAYVTNAGNNNVQVVDLRTGETLTKLYTGATPWRAFLSPDRQSLWVNHWYSETTSVIGLKDHEISQVLPYRGPGTFTLDGSQYVTYS